MHRLRKAQIGLAGVDLDQAGLIFPINRRYESALIPISCWYGTKSHSTFRQIMIPQ